MPLTELPPEVLAEIVSYLGVQFFREDLCRLTLFRTWHAQAMRIIREHVILGNAAIINCSRETHRLFYEPEKAFIPGWARLQTRQLTLDFHDLNRCDINDGDWYGYWKEQKSIVPHFNKALHRMVGHEMPNLFLPLLKLKRLEKLRLRIGFQFMAGKRHEHDSFYPCIATSTVLMKQLAVLPKACFTRLELQFPCECLCRTRHYNHDCVCGPVNELLCSQRHLKELRLGVNEFCTSLLTDPRDKMPGEDSLAMKKLLIYCNLNKGRGFYTHILHQPERIPGQEQAYGLSELRQASKAWVALMREPEMVRILWREEGSDYQKAVLELPDEEYPCNLVFDCLTSETMTLPLEADWASEGEHVYIRRRASTHRRFRELIRSKN